MPDFAGKADLQLVGDRREKSPFAAPGSRRKPDEDILVKKAGT